MSDAKTYERLRTELAEIDSAGLYKRERQITTPQRVAIETRERGRVLNFCANNYLGLADHPDVVAAGKAALDDYGAGTASVRFICGTFTPHVELERDLADFFGTEAALGYVSCWNANEGVIPTIVGPEDALFTDELNHASLIDAMRLARKTPRHIYKHADMADLDAKLKEGSSARRKLVVTDGVFSMEGDLAPLDDIVELARKHNAAVLVDDSHGTGVLGKTGRGTAEHFGVENDIDILTSTLGKALGGAAGGFVASSRAVIETLVQASRPQLFSNALPPTVAASSRAALDVLRNEPERVTDLHRKVRLFRNLLVEAGFNPLEGHSAIVPIIVGDTAKAIRMSSALYEKGFYVIGFGYPVVPEGVARIRVQISATMSEDDLRRAIPAFIEVGREEGVLS